MTSVPPPICIGCKHFRAGADTISCGAFPDLIPIEIIQSQADHREPYSNDHGIRYEPMTPEDAQYAEWMFENGLFVPPENVETRRRLERSER